MFHRIVLCTVALAFVAGFVGNEKIVAGDDAIRIGVLANNGSEACLKQWKATADYLSQKTGKTIAIQPLDFDMVSSFIKGKKVDFFLVNSAMYCEIEEGIRAVSRSPL